MYNDLKKYIIPNPSICNPSIAWDFKSICERSKDQDLVKRLLKNIAESREEILDIEFNPFVSMIESFHVQDIFGDENAIFKLILSCFTLDYDFFWLGSDMVDIFYNYTTRGQKACNGSFEDKELISFFDSFNEFVGMFNEFTDEQLKEFWDSRDMYEINSNFEEMNIFTLGIVLDERKNEYEDLKYLLNEMSFSEVVPGIFVYCCISYFREYSEYDSLPKEELEYIIDVAPIVNTELQSYDKIFMILNLENSYAFEILRRIKGNSKREVMF